MTSINWLRDRLSLTHRVAGTCLWDSFVPEEMRHDPELLRRARLQIRFGWLGCIFGSAYVLFYLLIGHNLGAEVIIACSASFGITPWLLKRAKSLHLTGNLFALTLLGGFASLTAIEGGLHGHAIAWLASVPLFVMLMLEMRGALLWSMLCFLTAATFAVMEILGVHFPKTYPHQWEPILNFAGYCGLIPFMILLGVIFERTRARAFSQLESAMAQLSVANQRLQKLNEDKNEFLKIAAHDLKNPLSAITGYAGLLTLTGMPSWERIVEASQIIQGQSKRMTGIISNLLDVQRIEEGSVRLKIAKYSIQRIILDMIKSYQQRAAHKGMSLVLDAPGSLPLVLADESAVQQILDNLISNAIKYAPNNSAITCSLVPSEDSVNVEVRDEGPGLSADDQKKLFKKFSRLTPQPTGGESSNGLGLWIVQRMAQAMNGDVFCESILGKGSTFVLRLPAWKLDLAAETDAKVAASRTTKSEGARPALAAEYAPTV